MPTAPRMRRPLLAARAPAGVVALGRRALAAYAILTDQEHVVEHGLDLSLGEEFFVEGLMCATGYEGTPSATFRISSIP